MKTLEEHFNEMIKNIKINNNTIEQAFIKKISKIEYVNNDELIKYEDEMRQFVINDEIFKITIRKLKEIKNCIIY